MSVQKKGPMSKPKEKARVEPIQTPTSTKEASNSDSQPIARPGHRQDPPN